MKRLAEDREAWRPVSSHSTECVPQNITFSHTKYEVQMPYTIYILRGHIDVYTFIETVRYSVMQTKIHLFLIKNLTADTVMFLFL